MTNRQWLLNKMQNMSDEELYERINLAPYLNCANVKCAGISCRKCVKGWLNIEHKEQIKLSDAERVILENVDKDYEWICRDKNGCLNVYIGKPTKSEKAQIWVWHTDYRGIDVFPNLFQFIKWENEQAYNIEELLKGE